MLCVAEFPLKTSVFAQIDSKPINEYFITINDITSVRIGTSLRSRKELNVEVLQIHSTKIRINFLWGKDFFFFDASQAFRR